MATSSALGSSNSTYYIIFARPCSNRGGVDGGGGISSRSSLGSTSPFPLPLSLILLGGGGGRGIGGGGGTHAQKAE